MIFGVRRLAAAFLLLVSLPAAPEGEICIQCHAETAPAHKRNSCASCHQGTAAHLAAPAHGNIFNPGRADRAQADASCLRCHGSLVPAAHWQGNEHARAGVGCVDCHRVHENEPKAESETCYACHAVVRRAQLQRSTHLLPDDHRGARMECSECHDLHASRGPKLLRTPRVNALCESCHDEKRGPFLWEHGPVRDNCLTCHAAHGSNNTHLLTMRVPMLCQSCHAGDAHTTLAASSSSAWLTNRGCVNCHQMVHGSNHPSGVTLQR